MRNRGGIQGVASSPVIVGAVTVLVVIVAVFLAYNANNGLPFVSTYDLKARVPERRRAGQRQRGADRRRRGSASSSRWCRCRPATAVSPPNSSLSLDKSAEPLPDDSTMIIRPEIAARPQVPADRPRQLLRRASPPAKRSRSPRRQPEPVDIDQFFDMFDEQTRKAIQRNLAGFGNALAGRGPQLNEAFGAAAPAGRKRASRSLRTIVAPSTDFGGFWRALEDLSATVAPVAETQASMFVALDRTFAAFARVSRPYIQETISKGPADPRRGQRRPAGAAPLPATTPPASSPRSQPGAKALARNLADDRRRAARRHPGPQPHRRCSTPS